MQDRKIRFSETLPGRRFSPTYFKPPPLRLFGSLFSSGDGPTYFALKRAKLDPKIILFVSANKPKK